MLFVNKNHCDVMYVTKIEFERQRHQGRKAMRKKVLADA